MAVVIQTNRAWGVLQTPRTMLGVLRKSETAKSSTVKGAKSHIVDEALVLKVWQETVPNWERTRCCDVEGFPSTMGNPSFYFRREKSKQQSAMTVSLGNYARRERWDIRTRPAS